ncbi:unnamed protein product [Sphagnum jensenii]|uniref:Lipoyl-binding domain-containing protein n=1 Tax=Sphagnum jensenii TaxID=128206 RepID=A0ABP1ADG9_9BRYO
MALCPSPVCSGALEATGFGVQACEGRGTTVRATSMSISMPRLREAPFQKLHVSMSGPTSWSHQRLHQTSCVVAEASEVTLDKEEEEVTTEKDPNPLIPNSFEIQSLIMEVCDETSIAELQLKMGDFSLRVKREIGKIAAAAPVAQPAPPVPTKPMLESIPAASIPTAPKPTALSAAIVKPVSNFGLLEAAADAGLLFVTSPKVGYFRKGRVVKGKKGPPLCEEGQIINKGQVVCYLEQLGTQQPVESDITGEVEKVLWKDGEPVGYGDPLIAIRPSFQGIKIKKFNE